MKSYETKNVVKGALLLTIAGLISKILSAGYRIPLQNLTGDYGYYVYQQVYPLLGMMMIVSLYGFPSAVAKLTADFQRQGKRLSWKSFYGPIGLILLVINGLCFIALYFGARPLSLIIGDSQLMSIYQLAAFTFLFIPFTSLLRGVFQGTSQMRPFALSQLSEQVIRVFVIVLAAYFCHVGLIDVYQIGQAGVIASILGMVGSFVVLILCSRSLFMVRDEFSISIPWVDYLRKILLYGVFASLNHMVLLVIQFADVLTLVPSLLSHGFSPIEAMKAKGVFDRGQPLIQVGTVVGSSFGLAFIPEISKQKLQQEPEQLHGSIKRGLAVCIYLSMAATIGLIAIFPETNLLLFQDLQGTSSLQILSVTILLSSLTITMASILQGLGYFRYTGSMILLAFAIKWLMNHLFVPLWGITGSAMATVFSMAILVISLLVKLKKILPNLRIYRLVHWKGFLVALVGLVLYLQLIAQLLPYDLINSRTVLLIYVIYVAISGALLYIVLLVKGGVFSEQELANLPFSSFLMRIYKGRD